MFHGFVFVVDVGLHFGCHVASNFENACGWMPRGPPQIIMVTVGVALMTHICACLFYLLGSLAADEDPPAPTEVCWRDLGISELACSKSPNALNKHHSKRWNTPGWYARRS